MAGIQRKYWTFRRTSGHNSSPMWFSRQMLVTVTHCVSPDLRLNTHERGDLHENKDASTFTSWFRVQFCFAPLCTASLAQTFPPIIQLGGALRASL